MFATSSRRMPSGLPHRSGRITRLAHAILNGFTVAPVFFATSGAPYSAGVGGRAAGGLRAGINGGGQPSLSRFPLFSRNAFRLPKIVNVDLRISRRFRIMNRANLEILVEAFNLLNRTQVTELNTRMYEAGGTAAASTLTFDRSFQTVRAAGNNVVRERQLQFGCSHGVLNETRAPTVADLQRPVGTVTGTDRPLRNKVREQTHLPTTSASRTRWFAELGPRLLMIALAPGADAAGGACLSALPSSGRSPRIGAVPSESALAQAPRSVSWFCCSAPQSLRENASRHLTPRRRHPPDRRPRRRCLRVDADLTATLSSP